MGSRCRTARHWLMLPSHTPVVGVGLLRVHRPRLWRLVRRVLRPGRVWGAHRQIREHARRGMKTQQLLPWACLQWLHRPALHQLTNAPRSPQTNTRAHLVRHLSRWRRRLCLLLAVLQVVLALVRLVQVALLRGGCSMAAGPVGWGGLVGRQEPPWREHAPCRACAFIMSLKAEEALPTPMSKLSARSGSSAGSSCSGGGRAAGGRREGGGVWPQLRQRLGPCCTEPWTRLLRPGDPLAGPPGAPSCQQAGAQRPQGPPGGHCWGAALRLLHGCCRGEHGSGSRASKF